MRYPMLNRIPFLAIAVTLFTIFFVSAVFVYGSAAPEPAADRRGRVLGASEAGGQYRWQEFYAADHLFPANANAEEETRTAPVRKEDAGDEVDLGAKSVAVLDIESGEIIFGRQADRQAPIASITKLMTALVFLGINPGWDSVYTVGAGDSVGEGRIYVYTGERVSVRDLFYLSLVGSANNAAMALVNATGLTADEFVEKMNERAGELGLPRTNFADPVGLSAYNVSTADEAARLVAAALGAEEIREATLTRKYEFFTLGGRNVSVENTDILLELFPQNGLRILGGKTGYTESAGYCFAGMFTDAGGREIVSAVLGAATPNARFRETRLLVAWIYDNYSWPER